VNSPAPHDPKRQTPQDAAAANTRAWQELQIQLQELHARLQYAKLMLRLGVRAR
jgi:hypothetical protein